MVAQTHTMFFSQQVAKLEANFSLMKKKQCRQRKSFPVLVPPDPTMFTFNIKYLLLM